MTRLTAKLNLPRVSWIQAPLQASIAPLLKGYQVGLETGDIESAGWCLVNRCFHLFYSARPLDCVQKEIDACIERMSDENKVMISGDTVYIIV